MSTVRVAAILASHNRRDLTLACLGRFIRSAEAAGVETDIFLADSASADGTVDAVKTQYPHAHVLELPSTLWWAGAMRRAIMAAQEESLADFLLWLNDDVMLEEGAIAELLGAHAGAQADNHKGNIIVAAVSDPTSGAITYSGQRRLGGHPLRLVRLEPNGSLQACDTFNGNIVLVPGAVSHALGGIDPLFDAVQGMADTDFGFRANAAGYGVWLAPRVLGLCAANMAVAPWRDGRLDLKGRLAAIVGARGYPWRAWSGLLRRQGGLLWRLRALRTYVRCFWESLFLTEKGQPEKPRVAFVEGLLPSYRIGLFQALKHRDALDFDIYFGSGLGQQTPRSIKAEILGPHARPRANRFWPGGGGRVAWSGGSLAAILGNYQAVVGSFHTHDAGIWLVWVVRRLFGRPRLLLSGHFRLDSEEDRLGRTFLSRLHLRLRRGARILMARGADAVLPYTEEGRQSCLKHGVDRRAIFVTHNTLDVLACQQAAAALSPDEVERVRARHGITARAVFLFVGRLYRDKRLDVAIDAVAGLRAQGHDCQLVIVGDGPEEETLRRHGAGGQVVFVPPLFAEPDLAPFFMMAMAQLQPDSAGLAVVHSFAYGLPVVIGRGVLHGPEVAYLRPGENGLVAEAVEGPAIADCLRQLMTEAGLAQRLSQKARLTAAGLTPAKSADAIIEAVRYTLGEAYGNGVPAQGGEG